MNTIQLNNNMALKQLCITFDFQDTFAMETENTMNLIVLYKNFFQSEDWTAHKDICLKHKVKTNKEGIQT